jgi:hypothetical protein
MPAELISVTLSRPEVPLGPVEQLRDVDSGGGAGDHPEVGKRRVAPADRRPTVEDGTVAAALGEPLERRSGIGDRDEPPTGLLGCRPGPVPCRPRGADEKHHPLGDAEDRTCEPSAIHDLRAACAGRYDQSGRRALKSEEAISRETRRIATSHPVRHQDSAPGTGAWKHTVGESLWMSV